jgi:DNA-binding MarR family transcriptional regulator
MAMEGRGGKNVPAGGRFTMNPAAANKPSRESENNAYLVRQLHRAFLRLLASYLSPHGLTPLQWTILRQLWRRDGDSQVQLAQAVGVEKATLTSVLDSLERRRLIKRVRSTEDRRKYGIYLTTSGRALEADLLPYADKVNGQATTGISKRDIKAFRHVLFQMLDNLS